MISVFIRTYHKDIEWLMYSLESIHKNLIGWDEIVICIPVGQESYLASLSKERVVTCKIYKDDYLGQQISKLKAHEYCKGDYILFVDSDVIFYPGAHVRDYFQDNKPVILKQHYSLVGEAKCWKQPTEDLFKETVDYEYMRRAPQLFHRSTLEKFNENFPDIENHIQGLSYRKFSEFNALGFFAERVQPDEYEFIDLAHNSTPENKSKQFWSWSGCTNEDRFEIRKIIGCYKKLNELETRDDIGHVLNEMKLNGDGVEVGVAFGENAEMVLSKSGLKTLYLIDPWCHVLGEDAKGYADAIKDWEGCLAFCISKLQKFGNRAKTIRETSFIGSRMFQNESLDFVYIDANHMSPMIDNDLMYWYDKVKHGGIFGGHDYHNILREDYQCDVKTAVDKFFKDKGKKIHVTKDADPSWYIIK
jgi:hypothetical protein